MEWVAVREDSNLFPVYSLLVGVQIVPMLRRKRPPYGMQSGPTNLFTITMTE